MSVGATSMPVITSACDDDDDELDGHGSSLSVASEDL